jgi:hypothetical protein
MPLKTGKSKEIFGENVAAERAAGKPLPQALAIAYRVAGKAKPKAAAAKPPKSRLDLTRKRSAHAKRTAHLRAARTSKQRAPYFAKFVD